MEKYRKPIFFTAVVAMAYMLLSNGFSPDKFLYGLDTFTLQLPFLMLAKKTWAVFHDMPLWMPDIFLGMPMIDSANLMYFYPTNLLFVLLPIPAEASYIIDLAIHMALAGFGMYLLLRRLNMSAGAGFFGAVVFIFSGPLITSVYNGHWNNIKAVALVPYVFYFIHRAVEEKKLFFYLTAGLFTALQVLALGMQIAVYTYAGASFYALYLLYSKKPGKKEVVNNLIFFLAASAGAILFCAPQFFPSQEYMKFSWRGALDYPGFTEFSFHPLETITLILPQFFGLKDATYWGFAAGSALSFYCGALPLLLTCFAFPKGSRGGKPLFFLALGAAYLLLAYGGYTPLYKLLYHIPVINGFRNPARAMCMVPLILAVLSAAGLDRILNMHGQAGQDKKEKERVRKIFNMLLVTVSLIIFLAGAVVFSKGFLSSVIFRLYAAGHARFMNAPMPPGAGLIIGGLIKQDVVYLIIFCGLFFSVVYLWMKKKPALALVFTLCLACFQFFDMYRVEKQFIIYKSVEETAESNPAASYMKADQSIFRVADLAFAWFPNKTVYYGLESFLGYHAVVHGKMMKALSEELYRNIKVMRLFNVKYYLNRSDHAEYAAWGLEKKVDGEVKVFEDKKYYPRAFISDRIKRLKDDDEILSYMKNDGFDPAEALVKDPVDIPQTRVKLEASAPITEYSPNYLKIRAKSNKDGILVLSNLYYHRWKARVDGRPAVIYNVDYILCGVKVPAGEHEVYFYYDRSLIVWCIIIMLAALLAYAGVGFFEFRRKNP